MGVLLALVSSLAWGSADFMGGVATRRVGALRVLVISYPVGAVVITLAALFLVPGVLVARTVAVGMVAGSVGAVAIGLLYAALARGHMGVVSPITAVLSGAVPVTVGLVRGERLTWLATAGITVAAVAVILVSREKRGAPRTTPPVALAYAFGSGLAIGTYVSILGTAPGDSGIWVTTVGRWFSSIVVACALLVIVLARTRPSLRSGSNSREHYPWLLVVIAGAFDAIANGVFQIAARNGVLVIVAVIGSLYPAATVILARFLLHERLSRPQVLGVVLALFAAATLAVA